MLSPHLPKEYSPNRAGINGPPLFLIFSSVVLELYNKNPIMIGCEPKDSCHKDINSNRGEELPPQWPLSYCLTTYGPFGISSFCLLILQR